MRMTTYLSLPSSSCLSSSSGPAEVDGCGSSEDGPGTGLSVVASSSEVSLDSASDLG